MSNQVMTQEAAVFQAFTNVCSEWDQESKLEPTKEERAQVTEILVEGFKAGTIALKDTPSNQAKLADDAKLRSYCSGLQSNWLRKDERLNGNVKYTPKNPGSRAGSGDAMIKALRGLLATCTDLTDEDRSEINAKIEQRKSEIKPTTKIELNDAQIELLKNSGFSKFFE